MSYGHLSVQSFHVMLIYSIINLFHLLVRADIYVAFFLMNSYFPWINYLKPSDWLLYFKLILTSCVILLVVLVRLNEPSPWVLCVLSKRLMVETVIAGTFFGTCTLDIEGQNINSNLSFFFQPRGTKRL